MKSKKKPQIKSLKERPPVVVVLGHVDHGKTTLLDYIRKTNVVEKEAGGITQHIGAYQITHENKLITFIDTPGHEAFSQMRSRGARVADIAVLVVAGEEGVKLQTKEVISHIKKAKIPVVVAINKIDKPGANPNKVKRELAGEDILVESEGGKVPAVEVSAKTGQGIPELLEMILLVAELEELKADPTKPGKGVVIESYLDSQRGPTATFLVLDGILKKGDYVFSGFCYGRAKILEDFQGAGIQEAPPSAPAIVVGLNDVPMVGEKFSVISSEAEAKEKAFSFAKTVQKKESQSTAGRPEGEKKLLNIILKADVKGSLEAIEGTLKDMEKELEKENIGINILKSEAGDVSESDVKLAYSTKSLIIGFRVKASSAVSNLARRSGIKIHIFEVIYELVEGARKELSKLLEPEILREKLGKMKILAVFRKEKNRMVVGGKVTLGKVENKALIDVFRNKEKIGSGRIAQLQHNKKDVPEAEKGKEAGILFEGEPVIEEGDTLEIYRETRKQREL